MQRSSLTLGTDQVSPKVTTQRTQTGYGDPLLSGCVAITDTFTISSCDVEALLDISTAFADAALALSRLQDQEKAQATA